MARMKEYPRYNVISFRITDEEMHALRQLRKKRKTTYDQLIREALAATDFPVSMSPDEDELRSVCNG